MLISHSSFFFPARSRRRGKQYVYAHSAAPHIRARTLARKKGATQAEKRDELHFYIHSQSIHKSGFIRGWLHYEYCADLAVYKQSTIFFYGSLCGLMNFLYSRTVNKSISIRRQHPKKLREPAAHQWHIKRRATISQKKLSSPFSRTHTRVRDTSGNRIEKIRWT